MASGDSSDVSGSSSSQTPVKHDFSKVRAESFNESASESAAAALQASLSERQRSRADSYTVSDPIPEVDGK